MRKLKAYWAIAVFLVLVNLVVYSTKIGGEAVLAWTSDLLPVLCGIMATISLCITAGALKTRDLPKKAWSLLALGIGISTLAECAYLVLELVLGLDMDELSPSVADAIWMISYIPIFLSLCLFLWGYRKTGFPMGSIKRYIIGIILSLGVAVAAVVFVMAPIFGDTESGVLQKIVYAYYPLFDLLLLLPAIILIIITSQFGKGSLSLPWKLIALGFICWAIADLAYNILDWQGLYGSGSFIDLGWNVSYLVIGAAGLYQSALIRSK